MYADEPIRTHVEANQVHAIFDIPCEGRLPIDAVIKRLKEQYHTFVLWPANSPYQHSYEQYKKLFGEECVIVLQHPNMICEVIGGTVGLNEKKVTQRELTADLVAVGASHDDAKHITHALAKV